MQNRNQLDEYYASLKIANIVQTASSIMWGSLFLTQEAMITQARLENELTSSTVTYDEFAMSSVAESGSLTIENGQFSSSEINAAKYMKNLGYDVTLRMPEGTRAGGNTSDLIVNGQNYDVYTPITNNPDRIVSGIAAKYDQCVGVVLDLSKTNVTSEQLGDIIARLRGKGITSINDIIIIT